MQVSFDAGLLMPLVNIAFLILGIVLNSWDSTAMHKFRRVFRKGNNNVDEYS